jgi:hypothetical protein
VSSLVADADVKPQSTYMTGNPKDVVDLRRWLREHRSTPHRPESCGPTLPLLVRGRFRQSLRYAIHEWRGGNVTRAWRFLGIAEGQVSVLYDTSMDAHPALQKVERVRNIFLRGPLDESVLPTHPENHEADNKPPAGDSQ